MMKRFVFVAATVAGTLSGGAQATSVVLPDYACRELNISLDDELHAPLDAYPVRSKPSADAAVVGYPASVFAVKQPETQENGFVQVLLIKDVTGWLPASLVRAWSNPDFPNRRCRIVRRDNGRIAPQFYMPGQE